MLTPIDYHAGIAPREFNSHSATRFADPTRRQARMNKHAFFHPETSILRDEHEITF
jgi:hypothetical protein